MFTKRAYLEGYVRIEGESTYFNEMPNGVYRATGRDGDDEPIGRTYIVNDTKDTQSKWAMWNDFGGRWGLTSLWHIKDDGTRVLLWRE